MSLIGIALAAAVRAAVTRVIASGLPVTPDTVAQEVPSVIQDVPEIKNGLNAEPLVKSRVAVGTTMAWFPALCYCLYAGWMHGVDLPSYFSDPVLAVAVPAVVGAGWAFYGRVRSGLKPFTWFGLARN